MSLVVVTLFLPIQHNIKLRPHTHTNCMPQIVLYCQVATNVLRSCLEFVILFLRIGFPLFLVKKNKYFILDLQNTPTHTTIYFIFILNQPTKIKTDGGT